MCVRLGRKWAHCNMSGCIGTPQGEVCTHPMDSIQLYTFIYVCVTKLCKLLNLENVIQKKNVNMQMYPIGGGLYKFHGSHTILYIYTYICVCVTRLCKLQNLANVIKKCQCAYVPHTIKKYIYTCICVCVCVCITKLYKHQNLAYLMKNQYACAPYRLSIYCIYPIQLYIYLCMCVSMELHKLQNLANVIKKCLYAYVLYRDSCVYIACIPYT